MGVIIFLNSSPSCLCLDFLSRRCSKNDTYLLLRLQLITTTVPIKDKLFATVKSTNYLPNALVAREAEEKGASVGIWLDEEGNVAEGQNMNVGFLTTEGELLLPTFDRILSGCTAQRVLHLVPELVKENAIPGLKGLRLRKIPEAEARKAKEMMLIMSGWLILPVVEWDGKPVGNGKFVFFPSNSFS